MLTIKTTTCTPPTLEELAATKLAAIASKAAAENDTDTAEVVASIDCITKHLQQRIFDQTYTIDRPSIEIFIYRHEEHSIVVNRDATIMDVKRAVVKNIKLENIQGDIVDASAETLQIVWVNTCAWIGVCLNFSLTIYPDDYVIGRDCPLIMRDWDKGVCETKILVGSHPLESLMRTNNYERAIANGKNYQSALLCFLCHNRKRLASKASMFDRPRILK